MSKVYVALHTRTAVFGAMQSATQVEAAGSLQQTAITYSGSAHASPTL